MESSYRATEHLALGVPPIQLSIIIVNWNSVDYLRECFRSIRDTVTGIQYEIIVVDNLSADDSRRSLAAEEFATVRVLLPERNLGFVRANNLGASAALGRNLLFLNPDTLILRDAITVMLRALESDARLGVVGCKLLNRDMSLQTSCVQPVPTIANQILSLDLFRNRFPRLPLWGIGVLYEPDRDHVKPVAVVSGACLMVKRIVFDEVNGFSKDYFMYAEEVDLCFKVAQNGWAIGYVGTASVIHYGGQSSNQVKTNSFADVLMANSVYTFLWKSRGPAYALLYRGLQMCSGVLRLLLLAIGYVCFAASASSRRGPLLGAIVKWLGITRWAVGLEPWTKQLTVTVDR